MQLRSAWIWTMGANRCNSGSQAASASAKRSQARRSLWDNSELRDILPPIQAGVRAVEDLDRRTFATRPLNDTNATVWPAKTNESPSLKEATNVSST